MSIRAFFYLGGNHRAHNSHQNHTPGTVVSTSTLLLPLHCLKSNEFPHPPNQIFIVGLLCGIVFFQPPCSRRWLVVRCCHKSSLARSAVLTRSLSDARQSSSPTSVRPSLPSPSPATTYLPLPSMIGCCLLLHCPSTHSRCPPPACSRHPPTVRSSMRLPKGKAQCNRLPFL